MKTDLINTVLVLIALFSSAGLALSVGDSQAQTQSSHAPGDSQRHIIDATGTRIPSKAYQRIASTSLIADAILPELVASKRIVVVTESHRNRHPLAFKTQHAATFAYGSDLEALMPAEPDLILVSNMTGDTARIARARQLGYTLVDLGPMRGRESLLHSIKQLGMVLGVSERAEQLAKHFNSRMDRLRDAVPAAQRKRALYLSAYNDKMYGGTKGSSFHDVLHAAGLIDVAADAFPGQAWPQLRVEDILRLDPDLLVTPSGRAADLRRLPGLTAARALQSRDGIIEVDGVLLEDPGLLMLPAAEALHEKVYGKAVQSDQRDHHSHRDQHDNEKPDASK